MATISHLLHQYINFSGRNRIAIASDIWELRECPKKPANAGAKPHNCTIYPQRSCFLP